MADKPVWTFSVSGSTVSGRHTTWVSFRAGHHTDGKVCSVTRELELPYGMSWGNVYGWIQEALCSMIDSLDCSCDFKIEHDPACKEASHEEA